MPAVTIIIPVYNEKGRLEEVVKKLHAYEEVIIIDDGSTSPVESYINIVQYPNLRILRNDKNIGYIPSIRKGIAASKQNIIVTMDGDGEHRPEDIPLLIQKIETEGCDIVFGKRPNIARPSERWLLSLAKFFTHEHIDDSGTGFRALKSTYAKKLEFQGVCTCGMLLMECHYLNMKICEVEVNLPLVNKPRRIAWEHFFQYIYLIKYYLSKKLSF